MSLEDIPSRQIPTVKIILKDLGFGPATARDLASVVRVTSSHVRRTLRIMHRHGLVRISTWERGRGGLTPVWAISNGGNDTPRPKPLSKAEMWLRWQAKNIEIVRESKRKYEAKRKLKRAYERAARQQRGFVPERQEGNRETPGLHG